jgi:hypothetical protein
VTSFDLQPVTFQRLININNILEGKDFEKVLKDPTPLEAVKIAFCMFNDEDKKKLDDIVLKINGKEKKADAMMKLYYLISENNIADGYTNLVSLMSSVNENIINSFQQEEKNEKKKSQNTTSVFTQSMELEEIYDIIGSNYQYTFNTFLVELTPKTAFKLINIIDIRKNNEFCQLASLHGIDLSKSIINKKKEINDISEQEHAKMSDIMSNTLKDLQNVKK